MKVIDSRRLTGPSLLLDAPGAILDVQLDERVRDRAIALWRAAATRLLEQVGWPEQHLATRGFSGGASLAFTAPPDALYAATEVNEAAWAAAWAEVEGRVPEREAITAARLRQAIADERNPALMALREGARVRQLTFLAGEGLVSVGSGTWSQVWASTELPRAESVDWLHVHDIPVALVTGSNGKTTVVRLLAAIAAAAEYAGGITSTDGVSVKGVSLAEGDYSGPSGARLLLRRRDVQLAVLETARGGLLRRGLSVDRAAVAVVTNVADDHLGEFGIQDLEALADVKMLVTRALRPGAAAVLNGDDARLRARGERLGAPVVWFTLEPDAPWLARHLQSGGRAAVYADRTLMLAEGSGRTVVARVEDVPIAVGGAARHNVANALAAVAAAAALGLPMDAVTRGLARFGSADAENVGRANVMELGGVQVVIDYAHNPHGMAALAEMVAAMPARRRLVLIGQAGDRSDTSIRAMARTALALRPDRIVLKEMDRYLRGRRPGEVTELMADELINAGVPPERIARPGDELAAVRDALAWARPGDVLLLTVHQDRPVVLALLDRLRGERWSAGNRLGR
ncbi:MAG TPA: Mur ligase family protein [Gemmatimonadales bacterium]|nr:Mur ligase family protein [Gemmatimonadales bacterium]